VDECSVLAGGLAVAAKTVSDDHHSIRQHEAEQGDI
jgi:hypothetical protein